MERCNEIDKERLKSELSSLVDDFLSKHKKLSINWLAKKIGKSEGAIRHALNPKNSIIPGPDTVLKIVSIINKKNDIVSAINSAPHHTQLFLKNRFSIFLDNNSTINNDLPEIDSLETFIIFMACQKPLHKDVLIDLCGVRMTRKINELVKSEAITVDEMGYVTRNRKSEKKEFLPAEEVLKYAPQMYSFVDMENLSGTYSYTTCINVTKEFRIKVGNILQDAFKKIQLEHDKMENQGDHRLFLTLLADTINKTIILVVLFLSFTSTAIFANDKTYFSEQKNSQVLPLILMDGIGKPTNKDDTTKGGDDSGIGGMK